MISPYRVFTMLWHGVLTTFGAIQALRNWFSFLWDHPCTTLTNFFNFRTPMVGFPTGRDSAQFALAIVPGQRDPRTRFFFVPGQRDNGTSLPLETHGTHFRCILLIENQLSLVLGGSPLQSPFRLNIGYGWSLAEFVKVRRMQCSSLSKTH